MRIVVLDGYTLNPGDNPWTEIEQLGELVVYDRTPAELIVERSRGADVLLTNKTPLMADTLAQLPDLKLISVLATGYNVVDLAAARQNGVAVCNVPVYSTDTVAQFVFALLLELCLHVGLHDSAVKQGRWENSKDFAFWDTPLVELMGKTMGIAGLGRIGQRTAQIARAFGMNVIAYSPRPKDIPAAGEFEWVTLEEMFQRSDVISLHCPLTDENEGMVNKALLDQMKPSAFLINTGRGPLIVEQDLADALAEGKLAGAAVDVVSREPILGDNPLLKAPNCIITPHIAWAALDARKRLMHTTAENIKAFVAGTPVNVVN